MFGRDHVVVVVVVVVVVFTLKRSFYPTTSAVHPVSFLILHPREIQILWSQTVIQRESKTIAINQGKASEMLAYLVCTRTQQNKPDQRNTKNKN